MRCDPGLSSGCRTFDMFIHDFWADSGAAAPSLYEYLHQPGSGTMSSPATPDDSRSAAAYANPVGDLLADITNTTTVRAVMANGRYFDRRTLDSLLAERARQGP